MFTCPFCGGEIIIDETALQNGSSMTCSLCKEEIAIVTTEV